MPLLIIALVLPLALDTLAASTALGVGGVSSRQRMRASLMFGALEAAMPLVGLAIGRALGEAIGSAASYAAIALLFVIAIHMLFADDDDRDPAEPVSRGVGTSIMLGLMVSLDELAVGFTLGLLRLPIIPVIALIALQTFVVAQIGMRVGQGIRRRLRESAERFAGVALALLAVGLLVAQVVA